MTEKSMKDSPHFTARRGFIIAAAFSLVGLYVVWAVYGAAPLGLPAGGSGSGTEPISGGQAGHGDAGALSPDEFELSSATDIVVQNEGLRAIKS